MSLKIALTLFAIVTAALLCVLAIGGVLASFNEPEPSFIERMGESATPEELVAETVREIRAQVEFPVHDSDYESWVGIEGRGKVLTYRFVAHNVEHFRFDAETVQNYMESNICVDGEIRYMLRAGVEIVYAYTIADTGETFSVPLADTDCL